MKHQGIRLLKKEHCHDNVKQHLDFNPCFLVSVYWAEKARTSESLFHRKHTILHVDVPAFHNLIRSGNSFR